MALLVNAITLPFIILFSLPLFFTAIFTTSLALSTLLIRASIVYVEYVPPFLPPTHLLTLQTLPRPASISTPPNNPPLHSQTRLSSTTIIRLAHPTTHASPAAAANTTPTARPRLRERRRLGRPRRRSARDTALGSDDRAAGAASHESESEWQQCELQEGQERELDDAAGQQGQEGGVG